MSTTRYLTRDDVIALARDLDLPGLIGRMLVDTAHGKAGQAVRTEIAPGGGNGVLGIMPAYRLGEDPAFSAKVVCVIPGNPAKGLPAHQGIVALFDGVDGHLRLLADAGAVTEIRTAALTVLATRTLAGERAGSCLVIGAGHQAAAHLRAFSTLARPLELWARRENSAVELAAALRKDGIEITIAHELETAVRNAAVVTSVTGTQEPILRDEWLQPGVHLNAIGSSTPHVSEVPSATLRTSRIFVDDIESVLQLSGEMTRLKGAMPHLTALGGVLTEHARVPRTSTDRTVFKSVGVAVQDLALLAALDESARDLGKGQSITL